MRIEVAVTNGDSSKQRGDLLEDLSKKILEIQNYEVETQIRNTGMELDLLCKNRANHSKRIYVECKAYGVNSKIQADVIKNIVGIKYIKKYSEVWLIATSELGKDAKGLKDDIECGEDSRDFTFYTPNRLIEVLQSSKIICDPSIVYNHISNKIYKNKIKEDFLLLITEYGYFYLVEHIESGTAIDVFVANANNGCIVEDKGLLIKLKETDNSYKIFSFESNINFLINNPDSNNVSKLITIPQEDTLVLNESYVKVLNDIGIKLTHPNKSELILSDIFVYQDLQDIEDNTKIKISSQKLLSIKEYPKWVIFGEEVSGKTALIKTLQKEFNRIGLTPVFVDAKDIKSSDLTKFESQLYKNFTKQYIEIKHDMFKKQYNKMIILIDNFESLPIKKINYKSSFLKMINNNFSNTLIFSDDSAEMELMIKEDFRGNLDGFKFFKIKEYGYELRDKMAEKWISIGQEELIHDNELMERKDDFSKKLETVIGNKFIPKYPLYIITLLQQIEAGTNSNLGGSAYAEFYNYLIVQAMGNVGIKSDELDFYHTYLSYIAYYFFINRKRELERAEIEKIHNQYSTEYHKNFSTVYDKLVYAKLIRENNDLYSFGHNYIYYFYVAKYFSDNMEKRNKSNEIKDQIDKLIKRLYVSEFANIVIFLIHHSKTRAESIIDKILDEARQIFRDTACATLSVNELCEINKLVTEEIKTIIEDRTPNEYRAKELKTKDELYDIEEDKERERQESLPSYNEEIKELDVFGKINLSIKLMEIIGQIAKNYYGSLEKNDKKILLSEVCSLGLRNLKFFINQFNEYGPLLEKEIQDKVKKKNTISKLDAEKISKRIIFSFMELICIFFIKKISSNIVSKNLFEDIDGLESDSEVMKLINTSTKLYFPNGLNKDKVVLLSQDFSALNNSVAKELLKFLVIEHFYKFDVDLRKKQEICDKIGIGIATRKNILASKSKNNLL